MEVPIRNSLFLVNGVEYPAEELANGVWLKVEETQDYIPLIKIKNSWYILVATEYVAKPITIEGYQTVEPTKETLFQIDNQQFKVTDTLVGFLVQGYVAVLVEKDWIVFYPTEEDRKISSLSSIAPKKFKARKFEIANTIKDVTNPNKPSEGIIISHNPELITYYSADRKIRQVKPENVELGGLFHHIGVLSHNINIYIYAFEKSERFQIGQEINYWTKDGHLSHGIIVSKNKDNLTFSIKEPSGNISKDNYYLALELSKEEFNEIRQRLYLTTQPRLIPQTAKLMMPVSLVVDNPENEEYGFIIRMNPKEAIVYTELHNVYSLPYNKLEEYLHTPSLLSLKKEMEKSLRLLQRLRPSEKIKVWLQNKQKEAIFIERTAQGFLAKMGGKDYSFDYPQLVA